MLVDSSENAVGQQVSWSSGAETNPSKLFVDVNKLKKGPRQTAVLEAKEKAKYHNGFTGRLVKNKSFEVVTILVVVANAVEIGWETDHAARLGRTEQTIGFIVAENLFTVYFLLEIFVRFLAYNEKVTCFKDGWFVFDSFLVVFMVWENWFYPFMRNSILVLTKLMRSLRLLRVARLAKIMRSVPALLLIIKGIGAATRAVMWTAMLLVIITYTWAILFTSEYHQGLTEEDDAAEIEELFGSMGKSFFSLLIMGTILDDVTLCTDVIRGTGKIWFLLAFVVYIIINSFTMMNMLVGVLVEMVGASAEGDKKKQIEDNFHEAMRLVFESMDKDRDGTVTREEFAELRHNKYLMKSLNDLKISEKQVDALGVILYGEEEEAAKVDFNTLIEVMLRYGLTGGAKGLDFNSLKATFRSTDKTVTEKVGELEKMCERLATSFAKILHPRPEQVIAKDKNLETSCTSALAMALPRPEEVQTSRLIDLNMLSELESAPSADIINELQRRCGMSNFEEMGVPLSMLEEELQARVCAHSYFLSMDIPPPDPEWSKESFLC